MLGGGLESDTWTSNQDPKIGQLGDYGPVKGPEGGRLGPSTQKAAELSFTPTCDTHHTRGL